MKNETMTSEIEFPSTYKLIKRNSKKLLILLHGFAQTNDSILEQFIDEVPDDYDILAPNGPFPIPKIRKDYTEKRYAWYFFDRRTNTYDISYSFPSKLIKEITSTLGYKNTPKTIIGYSQGGYLSPFAALELENVDSVIGLCCTYKWQYLPENLPFNVYSIHGEEDKMVDHQNSKEHFNKLVEKLNKDSKYISIKNAGHALSPLFIRESINFL